MDSGGPLLWTNPHTKSLVLAGIMFSGIACAAGEPNIGARIGSYVGWIVSETKGKIDRKPVPINGWANNCFVL